MKIRIKGNSLRLRLTQTDVLSLGKCGWVEEQTQFANAILRYRLQRSDDRQSLCATFSDNTVTVFIPANNAELLVNTDRVGFDESQPVDGENALSILVEKDFKCLDQTLEDQSDMYVNPNKIC